MPDFSHVRSNKCKCTTVTCAYQKKEQTGCVLEEIHIRHGKCQNFKPNVWYYILNTLSLVVDRKYLLPSEMTEEVRYGCYFIMHLYNVKVEQMQYGSMEVYCFTDKDGQQVDGNEIIFRFHANMSNERLDYYNDLVTQGKLPPYEDDIKQMEKEKEREAEVRRELLTYFRDRKTSDVRYGGGWLTPQGDFLPVDYGQHYSSAKEICKKYHWSYESEGSPVVYLVNVKGYVKLYEVPALSSPEYELNAEKLTKEQASFLYCYYSSYDDEYRAKDFLRRIEEIKKRHK